MNKESLLQKNESLAIKGLLMMLIITGHNHIFTQFFDSDFKFLYAFHVQCFFILPFFYPDKKITTQRVKDYFTRFWYPFLIFFLSLSCVCYILDSQGLMPKNGELLPTGTDVSFPHFLLATITGNWFLIDHFSGFQYLWFLPVMCSTMILKDSFTSLKKVFKIALIIFGALSFVLFFVFQYQPPYDSTINYQLLNLSLFAVFQGAGALFMGVTAVLLIKRFNSKYVWISYTVFTILLVLYFIKPLISFDTEYLNRFLLPYIFFDIIYANRNRLSKLNFLKQIGKYSFLIYLIHPFVIKVLGLPITHYLGINWYTAILSLFAFILISYYLSKWTNNTKFVSRFILPRNWATLRGKKDS